MNSNTSLVSFYHTPKSVPMIRNGKLWRQLLALRSAVAMIMGADSARAYILRSIRSLRLDENFKLEQSRHLIPRS